MTRARSEQIDKSKIPQREEGMHYGDRIPKDALVDLSAFPENYQRPVAVIIKLGGGNPDDEEE